MKLHRSTASPGWLLVLGCSLIELSQAFVPVAPLSSSVAASTRGNAFNRFTLSATVSSETKASPGEYSGSCSGEEMYAWLTSTAFTYFLQ